MLPWVIPDQVRGARNRAAICQPAIIAPFCQTRSTLRPPSSSGGDLPFGRSVSRVTLSKAPDPASARLTWYPYCPIPVIAGGNGLTIARCLPTMSSIIAKEPLFDNAHQNGYIRIRAPCPIVRS
jgi:hypothetical protein